VVFVSFLIDGHTHLGEYLAKIFRRRGSWAIVFVILSPGCSKLFSTAGLN